MRNWVLNHARYLFSLLRVFLVVMTALLVPQYFSWRHTNESVTPEPQKTGSAQGLRLTSAFIRQCSARDENHIALITDQYESAALLVQEVEHLRSQGITVESLVLSEPLQGATTDLKQPVHVFRDERTLASLLTPNTVLLIDIHKVGIAYHSSTQLLVAAMHAAAQHDQTVIVIDRPNMLGSTIEGAIGFSAHPLIADATLPARYGLTSGELARYCNDYMLEHPACLHVVPLDNYTRTARTAQQSVLRELYGYSLLALLCHVRPLQVRYDASRECHCVLLSESWGLDKKSWFTLGAQLKEHGIESTFYRIYKRSTAEYLSGLRLIVARPVAFSALNALLDTLLFLKQAHIPLTFLPTFDKAVGTSAIRTFIAGDLSWNDVQLQINKGLKHFFTQAHTAFLYKPYPKLMMV